MTIKLFAAYPQADIDRLVAAYRNTPDNCQLTEEEVLASALAGGVGRWGSAEEAIRRAAIFTMEMEASQGLETAEMPLLGYIPPPPLE